MHKFFALFKRDDGNTYPPELEDNYRISKKIGQGSFAVVKECFDKKTGEAYALKILTKKTIKGKENLLKTELGVLKKVNHPNIVKLQDLYETDIGVYIITELASGGELFSQLLLKGSYTERDAAGLVNQLLQGVAYLHDHGIVHRDLKPENLLFKDQSENARLMITDFGLSKIMKHQDDILMTACGTPGYVAPEVLLQTGHSKPVDIWSVGVITYILLCGYTPFWGEDQLALFEDIKSGSYEYEEEYWSEISDLAKDLIDKMLTYNPAKRITAHQALQHDWFKSPKDTPLLENVRKNFSARDTFKRAVHLIRGVNRIRKTLGNGGMGVENNNKHEKMTN